MTPKSVSGTSRILALAAVLLIPAWGWAEEPVKIGGPGCLMWVEYTGEVKIEGEDCRLPLANNWTPCELRMREAMRMIDKRFNSRNPNPANYSDNELIEMLATAEVREWRKTIKDCVEGK